MDERTKANVLSAFGKLPLHFVENHGQLPDEVVYYAKSEGATVYCTEEGLVFGFAEGSISLTFNAIADPSMSLRGAKRRSNLEARGELEGKVNYFIGNDPALWRTNIPTFAEVVYQDVYQGIDLVYSGAQRRLKYTFHLEPGTDPNQIKMIYDGIEGLSIDDDTGELVIQTKWGEMCDAKPLAYQEIEGLRKEVSISFCLLGENSIGFAVRDYDPKFSLTLDPGYSTYLGGSDWEWGNDIAVDSSGNAYVTGDTGSSNFPTQNPYQGALGGSSDAFVTKLNSDGQTLSYSTFLGGSEWDRGVGIAVDTSGNAYVTGDTGSSNFPTQNPYQDALGGVSDAFVTKLNSDGQTLSYSTFLGGSGEDWVWDIAVDGSGNAYVTGYTFSSNFPTQNPYQDALGGGYDAFVTKLNSDGQTLSYSTYLGGSDDDFGRGIAVDGSGNAYVTGSTRSSDFPTQNPFQGALGGSVDAFVTKLNSDGQTLSYSTYLGGSSGDSGSGIAVDGSGNAYVTGLTYSSDFPTQNPYQDALGGGYDAFVTKLNSDGQTLSYSTFLGGSGGDSGNDIAVDGSGNAYVMGITYSSDFPTQNPFQGAFGGGEYDAFVTKLNSDGQTLSYSTYLGGDNYDWGNGIAVDGSGNAYVTGITYSSDFPTQNPYQGAFGGVEDAFVSSYLSDGSLPVELSLFTATVSADGVTLRWRTESEISNLGFDIYRSDAREGPYTKVNPTRIQGAGTDATPHDYSFTDENVVFGKTYYYYIEDVDFSGKTNKSHIIEVKVGKQRAETRIVPPKFALFQNYPNPFNPETWFPYELGGEATVTIRIYDVNGRFVRELDLGKQKAGSYLDKQKAAYWDGKEQTGRSVSSGIYFYTLKAGDFQATRRMVILK